MDKSEQSNQIRGLLKTTPVRLHHAPGWFLKLCRQLWKVDGYHRTFEFTDDLPTLVGTSGWNWFDHWGSSVAGDDDTVCFVCEPYGLVATDLLVLERFADRVNCKFWVSPNSWWYPGFTTRLVFKPKE